MSSAKSTIDATGFCIASYRELIEKFDNVITFLILEYDLGAYLRTNLDRMRVLPDSCEQVMR